MNIEWQRVSQDEPINVGYRQLQRRVYRMPDGSEKEFTLKYEGHSVAIFAVSEDGSVLLAKQFRPGPGRVLHELPGGLIDEEETPVAAARRELLEETGHEAGSLELLGKYPADAYSTRLRHAFLARNCKQVSELALDDAEFIEVACVSLERCIELVMSGEMTETTTALLAFRKWKV